MVCRGYCALAYIRDTVWPDLPLRCWCILINGARFMHSSALLSVLYHPCTGASPKWEQSMSPNVVSHNVGRSDPGGRLYRSTGEGGERDRLPAVRTHRHRSFRRLTDCTAGATEEQGSVAYTWAVLAATNIPASAALDRSDHRVDLRYA